MTNKLEMNRRQFVVATAAVGGGLATGLRLPIAAWAQVVGAEINNWVIISPDNTILMKIGHQEMGQGIGNAMAQLLGEEMDVDWNKIKTEHVNIREHFERNKVYGSLSTAASRSITTDHLVLRQAGAQIRAMLLKAAAARLNVPEDQLTTDKSVITHAASNRKLTYGEVAAEAAKLPVPDAKAMKLRDPKDWKLIGKSFKRFDVPIKVNGSAIYGIDMQLPGMKTAAVMTSPVFGGKVKSYDANAALSRPGVRRVLEVKGGEAVGNPGGDDGIVVVADSYWQAKTALDAMPKEWDFGVSATRNSADFMKEFQSGLSGSADKVLRQQGDTAAAMRSAAKTIEADYYVPYVDHGVMEPINCTALVTDDGFKVWAPTQNPENTMTTAALAAGMPVTQGDVFVTLLGTGFGRRGRQDYTSQAIQVAKQMKGTPIKLVWSREETTRHGFYRPAVMVRMKGGLDALGNVTAWNWRMTSSTDNSTNVTTGSNNLAQLDILPNALVDIALRPNHVPIGALRGVAFTHNCWFSQSFIDEMAVAAGKDAYQFQRALVDPDKVPADLQNRDAAVLRLRRLRAVLDDVAKKSGWGTPMGPNRGRGIVVHEEARTMVAMVAEVTLDNGGWFTVDRVVSSVDSGYMVDPGNIVAQIEGGVVYGITMALYNEITIRNGRVVEGNFDDYQMMRIHEMPKVEVHFLPSQTDWGGIGEPSVPPILPAMTNAIYAAGGPRLRSLPLKNETINKRT